MSALEIGKLLARYADGRQLCNCCEAYEDADGRCAYGCSANQIMARSEIAVRVSDELAHLEGVIEAAPHEMGCASLQDRVPREQYGSLDLCNCWKARALEGK